jgi:hypothetical protein
MRIAEGHSARSQSVQIWGLRLAISSKMSDPVIQVIDGDEQDVQPIRSAVLGRASGKTGYYKPGR